MRSPNIMSPRVHFTMVVSACRSTTDALTTRFTWGLLNYTHGLMCLRMNIESTHFHAQFLVSKERHYGWLRFKCSLKRLVRLFQRRRKVRMLPHRLLHSFISNKNGRERESVHMSIMENPPNNPFIQTSIKSRTQKQREIPLKYTPPNRAAATKYEPTLPRS